jgi:hypothetical protein
MKQGAARMPAPLIGECIPGVNPGQPIPPVMVRFFLTESELMDGMIARKSLYRTKRWYRIAGRLVCAYGVYFLLTVPSKSGTSWTALARTNPLGALFFALMVIVDAYVAIGMPGMEALNQRVAHLDWERQVSLSMDKVVIRHGAKYYEKKWSDFRCYYESANVYVLQTFATQFWTVPKRAFEPGAEQPFRQLLAINLDRK